MPQMVLTGGQGGTTRRGLRDAFANAYDSVVEQTKADLAPVMALDLPSDTDQEFYAYFKDAPFPRFHPAGENMAKAGFASVQFSVINYDYSLEVEWRRNDEGDDQLRMLRPRAAQTGLNFVYRFTDAFFDVLLSTTSFLPATLTAPDGSAIFATTDGGGANRFGATNGNLLTGNGVASAATIRTDIFAAMAQFRLMQNTKGKPLFPPAILNQGFIVYAGAANEEILNEAFFQNPTSNIAPAAGAVAAQNIFAAAGKRVELQLHQQITDNDMYVFLRGTPYKPIFHQTREPLSEAYHDEITSAEHARAKLRSLMYTTRDGYGLWLPYGVVKINN